MQVGPPRPTARHGVQKLELSDQLTRALNDSSQLGLATTTRKRGFARDKIPELGAEDWDEWRRSSRIGILPRQQFGTNRRARPTALE
jgi:hypothetical protein